MARNRTKISLTIVIFILLLINSFNILKYKNNAIFTDLHGKLLVNPPVYISQMDEQLDNGSGLLIYDFDKGTNEKILSDYDLLHSQSMDIGTENILFCTNNSIFEYNIYSKRCNVLLEIDGTPFMPQYINYTPYISYVSVDSLGINLTLYNIENGESQIITQLADFYSYSSSPDGKQLVYNPANDENNIYSFNIHNGEIKKLFKGYHPVYSFDMRYIAFLKESQSTELTVKDLVTNEEWKHKKGIKFDYHFVPSCNKIAFTKKSIQSRKKFVVWDFVEDDEKILFEYCPRISEFDWK